MNGADGERSEAEGVNGAMTPEAASRGVAGTLARGKALKTDTRTRWARRRSASSSTAPEPDGLKRGVLTALTELATEVRRTAPEGLAAELTLRECEVRKRVTGGARTGEADMGGGADGERSEADGMSGAMPREAASRVCTGRVRGEPARR
ncbi:MAG: hypothetical protein OXN89_02730 [Bryobacterales bacterium]|nr:hypothetical protein [Bryobacterales bacterium]